MLQHVSLRPLRNLLGRQSQPPNNLRCRRNSGATDIRVKELLTRIAEDNIQEVILPPNPSVEGEATTLYLAKLLKPFNIKVSRIALGIPVGSDLEYADEITLARAIEGRREL